jgi:hypothetical protein
LYSTLKAPGVCCIPCECGKVCGGWTGRAVEAAYKDHALHIDKSAVAEHSVEVEHRINFKDITVLARTVSFMDLLVKKQYVERRLCLDIFTRDTSFPLS